MKTLRSKKTARKAAAKPKRTAGNKAAPASKKELLSPHEIYFRQLFASSLEGIVALNREDRIVEANPSFLRIFGFTLKEIVGQRLNDLIVPRNLGQEAEGLSKKVLNNEAVQTETVRRRKDGSMVHVSVLGAPILADGKRIGIFGIYRDISSQKKAEAALKESEVQYRRLVESASDIIYSTDLIGRFLYANPVALKITGYSEAEIVG